MPVTPVTTIISRWRPCSCLIWKAIGCALFALEILSAAVPAASPYFAIKVVDGDSGRGVPLVELRTVNEAAWWTDSNGLIAFDEPGLMELEVFFHVSSPGYEVIADGFGFRGVKLRPTRGGSATITVKRTNIAERLYRVTGAGIYRDTILLGQPAPTQRPDLNGQVMGQDTVIATPYRDRIYWFWGDTQRPRYPLGHFAVSGAVSELPGRGGLDPNVGIDLTYFVDETGFSKPMCPQPNKGMRWLEGVFTVMDANGRERLASRLAVMRDLGFAHEWHLVVFNEMSGVFESVQRWERHEPHQSAHPFASDVKGKRYIHIFPDWRSPAQLERMADLDNYEAFTCVAGDGKWRDAETKVQREPDGRVRFEWKRGADRLTNRRCAALVATQQLAADESPLRLIDIESGLPLRGRPESVAWNQFRRQWIAFASDKPGEVWFATADTPVGPWAYARRVVTHGDYNFYNIAHHSFLDQQSGRVVYFEGTYTDTFSAARAPTPRYNYNQMMYRLDLADDRLQLPVPIYARRDRTGAIRLQRMEQIVAAGAENEITGIAFFARPPTCRRSDAVPVFAVQTRTGTELSLAASAPGASPLFVALPLVPPAPNPGIDGVWHGRAKRSGDSGDGLDFEVEFVAEAGGITAIRPDGTKGGRGTISGERLSVRLEFDGVFYDCEAVIRGYEFKGTWRRVGGDDQGTWLGRREDLTPREMTSVAIVALRRVENAATRSWEYSVAPANVNEPAGVDICRVWKAPGRAVLLDATIRAAANVHSDAPPKRVD